MSLDQAASYAIAVGYVCCMWSFAPRLRVRLRTAVALGLFFALCATDHLHMASERVIIGGEVFYRSHGHLTIVHVVQAVAVFASLIYFRQDLDAASKGRP